MINIKHSLLIHNTISKVAVVDIIQGGMTINLLRRSTDYSHSPMSSSFKLQVKVYPTATSGRSAVQVLVKNPSSVKVPVEVKVNL